jgi:hypothetical protein
MVDAERPPTKVDIEAQYGLHRAKRERQMEKLESEVAEMRAEHALRLELEHEVMSFRNDERIALFTHTISL